jgi:hypothetical protein
LFREPMTCGNGGEGKSGNGRSEEEKKRTVRLIVELLMPESEPRLTLSVVLCRMRVST